MTRIRSASRSSQRLNRLYIIPSFFGLVLVVLIVTTFFYAALYATQFFYPLPLLLLLAFMLSMFQTNTNLAGVKILQAYSRPFAAKTDEGTLVLTLKNQGANHRIALFVRVYLGKVEAVGFFPVVPKGEERSCVLSVPRLDRGVYPLAELRIFTTYPLGLFYAWTLQSVAHEIVVYPNPEGNFPLLISGTAETRYSSLLAEEFLGHRPFLRSSDSPRVLDWKAHARGQRYLAKQFVAEAPDCREIRWEHTPTVWSDERRLSQLSRWVDMCHSRGESFALHIPGATVATGRGEAHRVTCLRLLARWS